MLEGLRSRTEGSSPKSMFATLRRASGGGAGAVVGRRLRITPFQIDAVRRRVRGFVSSVSGGYSFSRPRFLHEAGTGRSFCGAEITRGGGWWCFRAAESDGKDSLLVKGAIVSSSSGLGGDTKGRVGNRYGQDKVSCSRQKGV